MTYDAIIAGGLGVIVDQNITIQRLTLSGGSLAATSSFSLTLNEGLTWTGGSIGLPLGVIFPEVMTINLAVGSISTFSGTSGAVDAIVNNSGTVNVNDSANFGGTAFQQINNLAGATWTWQAPAQFPFNPAGRDTHVDNAGNFVVVGGNFFTTQGFNNSGTVTTDPGAQFVLANGGSAASGTFNVGEFVLSESIETLSAGATINAVLTRVTTDATLQIAGNSTINSALSIEGSSKLEVEQGATLTLNGTFTQTPFESTLVHLKGGTFASAQPLSFHGSLIGSGTVNSNVSNDGTIAPSAPNGGSTGIITIADNLSLLTGSKIVMQIGGLIQGTQFDNLSVSGLVTLGGTLVLEMINGFQTLLDGNQTFTLLTSGGGITGGFGNIANGGRLLTVDGTASFQVNYGTGSQFNPANLVLSDPRIIPEPGSFLLLAIGAAAIGFVRFRRA